MCTFFQNTPLPSSRPPCVQSIGWSPPTLILGRHLFTVPYYLIYTAYISENIKFLAFVGSPWIDGLKLKYPEIHSIFECQFHPIKIIGHSIFLASHTHIHANMSFIEKKCQKLIFSIPKSRGELFENCAYFGYVGKNWNFSVFKDIPKHFSFSKGFLC